MSCSPNTGTVPPYSSSPNPYPAAVYPVRSTYPQQNPYAQVSRNVSLKDDRFWLLYLKHKMPEDGAIIKGLNLNFWCYKGSFFAVAVSYFTFKMLHFKSNVLNCIMFCCSVIQALIPSQQQGTYYTQPLYAAPPHVIHHTTVVQPNGMPAAMYAPPIPPPRHNGVAMGMVAGTTMAMSAGGLQLVLLFITIYIESKWLMWIYTDAHSASQGRCWRLHHQRLLLPTKSRCPHIGLLAHPATAMCPHSGEERAAWVWCLDDSSCLHLH